MKQKSITTDDSTDAKPPPSPPTHYAIRSTRVLLPPAPFSQFLRTHSPSTPNSSSSSSSSSAPPHRLVEAVIVVKDGKIENVYDFEMGSSSTPIKIPKTLQIFDYGNLVIMPGIVDAKVHLCDPGVFQKPPEPVSCFLQPPPPPTRATDQPPSPPPPLEVELESWEGFNSGTRAAAAGGVTFLADFPCFGHSRPTTNTLNLKNKIDAAKGKCHVDVAFYGLATPENIRQTDSTATATATDPDNDNDNDNDNINSLTALLDLGAIGVVAYLSRQSISVPGLRGSEWNNCLELLNNYALNNSKSNRRIPVMLGPVLMGAKRLQIVDPYVFLNSPYERIKARAPTMGAMVVNNAWGRCSQTSSLDNSPR